MKLAGKTLSSHRAHKRHHCENPNHTFRKMIHRIPVNQLKSECDAYDGSYHSTEWTQKPKTSKSSLLDDDDDTDEHDAIFFQRKSLTEEVEEEMGHDALCERMHEELKAYLGHCGKLQKLETGGCTLEFSGLRFVVNLQQGDDTSFMMTAFVHNFESSNRPSKSVHKKMKKLQPTLKNNTHLSMFDANIVLFTTKPSSLFARRNGRSDLQVQITEFLMTAMGVHKEFA